MRIRHHSRHVADGGLNKVIPLRSGDSGQVDPPSDSRRSESCSPEEGRKAGLDLESGRFPFTCHKAVGRDGER